MQSIANTAILLKPFRERCQPGRWIFNRPEAVPTSTRNNGSSIGQAATENDTFFPGEAKDWFCRLCRDEQWNAQLAKRLACQIFVLECLAVRLIPMVYIRTDCYCESIPNPRTKSKRLTHGLSRIT